MREPGTADFMLPPGYGEPEPARPPTVAEAFRMGGLAGVDQYQPTTNEPFARYDKAAAKRAAFEALPVLDHKPLVDLSGDTDLAQQVEEEAKLFVPTSPLDLGLMALGGPLRAPLKMGALALGAALDPSEAEAGVIGKLTRGLKKGAKAPESVENWRMGGVAEAEPPSALWQHQVPDTQTVPRMGAVADEVAYTPPAVVNPNAPPTGSLNPLANVDVTFAGKQPKDFTPQEWQAFGEHHGAKDIGPLSPLQTFKDMSGKEFSIPGGTEGKWTYYDLLHMKANPINPANVDRALHGEMQRKLGRTMTPDEMTDAQVWNGLVFGMTSPNNPLFPNQVTASRLRLRTPEMLDDLASSIPWKVGDEVSPQARKLANDQIAQRYALGAAPEGLGTRGTADYSRVAEMAQLFKQNPAFFRKQPDESWLQAVERISTQLPGLSAKTGSFGMVWQDPARAAISAIDRHMMKELDKKGGVFLDQAERKGWQDRALADWNKKYADDAAADFDDLLTKRGSDGYIGERLMNHINQPIEPKFRVKGEINPRVPEHLAQAQWVHEPEKITAVGRAYKQALDVNQKLANESGLDLFMSQWLEWDRIRNRFEPHENMFPGLSKLPAPSVEQLRGVDLAHKQTGHKTYGKTEAGTLQPTRPLEGLPSSMGYLGMGGVAAMPSIWPREE